MAKIEHLPITNKEKFERVLYAGGTYRHVFRMVHEIRECFTIYDSAEMGGHRATIHVNYRSERDLSIHVEGIGLEWYDNPFNLDFEEDNFIRYEECN